MDESRRWFLSRAPLAVAGVAAAAGGVAGAVAGVGAEMVAGNVVGEQAVFGHALADLALERMRLDLAELVAVERGLKPAGDDLWLQGAKASLDGTQKVTGEIRIPLDILVENSPDFAAFVKAMTDAGLATDESVLTIMLTSQGRDLRGMVTDEDVAIFAPDADGAVLEHPTPLDETMIRDDAVIPPTAQEV